MHPVMVENLEEYLSGNLLPATLRELEAHLSICPECREQVRGMQEVSSLLADLRSAEEWQPAPGFAARIMEQVNAQRRPSLWGLFSLDPGFGRRVVFASLLTLAVLGSYLVSRETQYTPGPSSPEAVMALDQGTTQDATPQANDREMMLVTLTSYEP
jgi:anti-sigma factor RsiW